MNKNQPNNQEDQEIDLTQISKKIVRLFEWINTFLFKCIQFFVKNAIVISILLVIGVGLGFYLDVTKKAYDHQIIVTPNFGSTDYLYSKIELIESKIKEGDTVFLKEIGIQEPTSITKISIDPIVDVYGFINNSEQNFELLKLMSEDGDLKSIVKETTTSKNYAFHTITVLTKGISESKKEIQPILNYLNTSDYYSKIQKVSVENIQQKINTNEGIVSQIDGILNEFSNSVSRNHQKSDKLVYYNENAQLNDIIKTKESLIKEIGNLKVVLLTSDKIVKENSITINIENTASTNGKLKLILPLLFVFMFILICFFIAFYKKQLLKTQQIKA
ncbi:hypothetical protein [Flavobacterium sp. ZB4P13]|uniref:hypothetical protein n=1 Tax=Flavobacterium sp. ZB4P13 TaxID=3401728 RepID=UPI003AAC2C3A